MKTKYKWITLASGERRCVEVQKRVVARSFWKRAPEEGCAAAHGDQKEEKEDECNRIEVRYERSARDPSRYNIVELRIREAKWIEIEDTSDSDMDYTTEGKDDDDSEISSYDEGRAFWEFRKDIKQLAQEAAEAQGEAIIAAGSFGPPGRGQRRKSTVHASSQEVKLKEKPEPPGLTAVRLLFPISSPAYRELLREKLDCLWIVRRCDDGQGSYRNSSLESVVRLCKQAGVQPKLARRLDYPACNSNCWLLELHSPHDGHLLAGDDGKYTSLFENHLYIWQKIKLEDFDKLTQWQIESLPPYLARLSGENLKQKIEALDKKQFRLQHFRSLGSLKHEYLSGRCILRGIAEYQSEVFQNAFQSTHFTVYDSVNNEDFHINVMCVEQCTFCGLDCSVKGDANYHNAQTCPYKRILELHQAQQAA